MSSSNSNSTPSHSGEMPQSSAFFASFCMPLHDSAPGLNATSSLNSSLQPTHPLEVLGMSVSSGSYFMAPQDSTHQTSTLPPPNSTSQSTCPGEVPGTLGSLREYFLDPQHTFANVQALESMASYHILTESLMSEYPAAQHSLAKPRALDFQSTSEDTLSSQAGNVLPLGNLHEERIRERDESTLAQFRESGTDVKSQTLARVNSKLDSSSKVTKESRYTVRTPRMARYRRVPMHHTTPIKNNASLASGSKSRLSRKLKPAKLTGLEDCLVQMALASSSSVPPAPMPSLAEPSEAGNPYAEMDSSHSPGATDFDAFADGKVSDRME